MYSVPGMLCKRGNISTFTVVTFEIQICFLKILVLKVVAYCENNDILFDFCKLSILHFFFSMSYSQNMS